MATAWVMHTSQLLKFPRCQLQPLLATLRKAMETMGCLAKMLASSNYDYPTWSWWSLSWFFYPPKLVQYLSGGGDVWEGTPSPALGCTVCGSQHDAFADGVWEVCIWSLSCLGERGCSKIMVPQMSTDSPEICPRGQGKHVVVIREHRWPIIHQDHLASTEHYNQIQAALHRSEVKTWWRFMNLMNPLLLGTFVHALL